jgi:quercetin dioxygenase-like cupin family protein
MAPKEANITLVAAGQAQDDEVLHLGPTTIRILEDGRNTSDRLGSMILTIPPKTAGPVIHWHRMHDETFFVTKGRIRFTTDKGDVDTKAGDYVIVPVRAVHTFSNPFDEEAEFFNTFTPAYYIDYLRMLCKAAGEAARGGRKLTDEEQKEIMAQFATFPPGEAYSF